MDLLIQFLYPAFSGYGQFSISYTILPSLGEGENCHNYTDSHGQFNSFTVPFACYSFRPGSLLIGSEAETGKVHHSVVVIINNPLEVKSASSRVYQFED